VLKKVRKKYRKFFFNKQKKKNKRNKKVVNYFDANSIGIIYDASIEDNYNFITECVKKIQSDNKKVNTLGYIKHKKLPDYCFPKLIFGFFFAKDFKWNYKPKSNFVKEFIESEYDILIDLSPCEIYHAKHIAGLSKAKYKTGKLNNEYLHIYDLMIDISDSSSIEELYENSLHYLKTINKK